MPATNLELTCAVCQKEMYRIENADITGYTNGELFNTLEKQEQLRNAGWALKRNPDPKIGRYLMCPKCLAEQVKSIEKLTPFVNEVRCEKCLSDLYAVVYRTGKEVDAIIPIEHLEVTCNRCKYKKAYGTADRSNLSRDIVQSN